MIIRRKYMDVIIPLIGKPLIKAITGVRRSGKTVLLNQVMDRLRESGVKDPNIVYLSFESYPTLSDIPDADSLYRYLISACGAADGMTYVFLDEIQAIDGWERICASLLIDTECDIYVAASDSKLLSGEYATLIAGRYIHIDVYPFSMSEIKEISIQNGKYTTDEALFQDYLRYGGLPMRFSLDDISIETYISDTYDAIVWKDIESGNKIRNSSLLRNILLFMMDNIANPFSIRSITKELKAEGIETTAETVSSYIGFMTRAMVLRPAERYDLKGKRLLQTYDKYYAADLGLRNIVKKEGSPDFGKLYENAVYLELLYRGYRVAVGKDGGREIDFVAFKGQEKIYVQVCCALSSQETVDREFGNLLRIEDNCPKYVVSGDTLDFSRDGVIHANIVDFLLERERRG